METIFKLLGRLLGRTIYFLKTKKVANVNIVVLLLILGIGGLIINHNFGDNRTRRSGSNTPNSAEVNNNNTSTESWTCSVCGKKIHGHGYEEVSEGVWSECKEPNQCLICSPSCGREYAYKMNRLSNGDKSDGKIYDQGVCKLCKGTGIEKNQSSLSDEYGRTCPMCDGKGKQGY